MGVNLRRPILDHRLQVDVHPYYGQNLLSAGGYYGTEFTATLGGGAPAQPWGKISFGYINGDEAMMDHGHGFDMHSEVNFSDHLSLDTGLRQNEYTDLGNYVMLRWKLAGD
jgi:hypothetical protein